MSEQPKALRLADAINYPDVLLGIESASELRRLHEVNQELLEALKRYLEAGVGQSTHFGVQLEAYFKARAAIAKATGETQ